MSAASSSLPTASPSSSRSNSLNVSAAGLSDIDSLIDSKQYCQILSIAQHKELEDGGSINKESEMWSCIQLYAAALAQTLPSSRFIWKRISKDVKKRNKDLNIIWKQLQCLHKLDFTNFFQASLTEQASLSSPLLQRLNSVLRDETQQSNLLAIRKAYNSIGLDEAAHLLGLKRDSIAAFLTDQGWKSDASRQYFEPTPLPISKPREISTQHLQQLTKYAVLLDAE